MAIYQDILNWSSNKPEWIKDTLRRIVRQNTLNSTDIVEILQLLKKEVGFTNIAITAIPLSNNDFPTLTTNTNHPTKLVEIKNPININALYDKTVLSLNQIGLNVIYGGNGSGKSGFARLLKKICWSRDNNVVIKPNVYNTNNLPQSAEIEYCINSVQSQFTWTPNGIIPNDLKSIYVFDKNCANIYLNYETPTEYKPIGIDILEELINVFGLINIEIDRELNQYNTILPIIDEKKYSETEIYKFYKSLTSKTREDVDNKFQYPDELENRKNELIELLSKSNPNKENNDLIQKKKRYQTLQDSLQKIENIFGKESINKIKLSQSDYFSKRDAYKIASNIFKGDDLLKGVGSETWRLLWEKAKQYAITEVHPENQLFPSGKSSEICVLCQQPLEEKARQRLSKFNTFISDTTSTEYEKSKNKIEEIINYLSGISISDNDTILELDTEIKGIKKDYEDFKLKIDNLKLELINSLKTDIEIKEQFNEIQISEKVKTSIIEIEKNILKNNTLIAEKENLQKELNELLCLSEIVAYKDTVLKYYDETKIKEKLHQAKSKTNTTQISRKIGELLEQNAITEQHNEFISHLSSLNNDLSTKVGLRKTRTSQGETYQQCKFQDINESIESILSEGEQKLIALSNFLAECTINNSKNTIVFDDPITSLDQNYKENISKKISEISQDRQVIVLTHDLNFVRLLIEDYKTVTNTDCNLLSLYSYQNFSGILSDDIPYLAKNIQERITTIRNDLQEISGISPTQIDKIENRTDNARKRFRLLLERTVEDILAGKSIQRFSKNISVKATQLSNFVIVEKADIDFILNLFGKYSVPEHDGGTATIYSLPNADEIRNDLNSYETWKTDFNNRRKTYLNTNGIN